MSDDQPGEQDLDRPGDAEAGAPPPPGGPFPSLSPPGYPPPPGSATPFPSPPPWAAPSPPGAPLPGSPTALTPPSPWPNGSSPGPVPLAQRRHRRGRVVVALLVAALVLAGIGVAAVVFGGSSPPSSTAPAARQLLRTALASATRAGSFHYVATSSSTGPNGGTQQTVGDAGPTSGRQVITAGQQHFTVLVIGTSLYFTGNASALTANLGLSSASAAAHAQQWIELAPTDAPYATVYAAVTAPSALADNITIAPDQELAQSTVAGQSVRTITGAITAIRIAGQVIKPKGTAFLAVRTGSPHLPVRYTQSGTENGQSSTASVSFSRWGESVSLSAPPHPLSYSSLGVGSGAQPSSPNGPVLT
jgi:hypothetical protein